MKSIASTVRRLKQAITTILKINERLDEIKINQAILLASINERSDSRNLRDYEFKVFSQWGEDGIIQRLINVVDIKNRTFIEFGVEDFFESNCRYLLMKDNWSGLVIDGSSSNINRLKESYFFWKHHILAVDAFITKDNINDLLAGSGFDEDLGILSVDLDGNDYHVLEKITFFRPRILICEYNSVFGSARNITVPYDEHFIRSNKHYSNLYWGASLGAMTWLANNRGYSLVGTNTAGNNAFYVRNDLLNDKLEVLSVEHAYSNSLYRESRDAEGRLSYVSGNDRLKMIEGMPVVNVETQAIEPL